MKVGALNFGPLNGFELLIHFILNVAFQLSELSGGEFVDVYCKFLLVVEIVNAVCHYFEDPDQLFVWEALDHLLQVPLLLVGHRLVYRVGLGGFGPRVLVALAEFLSQSVYLLVQITVNFLLQIFILENGLVIFAQLSCENVHEAVLGVVEEGV